MRRLTLAAAAAALLLPACAHAGAVDPVKYADRYCLLRFQGMDRRTATQQAVRHALDMTQPDPPMVTRYGFEVRQDSVDSALAAMKRCPEV
jgi:hypothetical protein